MTDTLFLDASMFKSWGCRERYRLQYVENLEPRKPNVFYELGKAVHAAVEAFWRGESYEKAMDIAYDICNHYPVGMLNPQETTHWTEQVKNLPSLIACYYDAVEHNPDQLLLVEREFAIPYDTGTSKGTDNRSLRGGIHSGVHSGNDTVPQVVICGRLDRLMRGPKLVDVKTASEISDKGTPWKKRYREQMLLDPQFGLYDWALSQMSLTPTECYLEVIIKPYKGKPARLEIVRLDEVVSEAYRTRFRQQLAWTVAEMVEYYRNYKGQQPWPMDSGHCTTKYGVCQFQPLCLWGKIPATEKLYQPRTEHLSVRMEKKDA